MNKESQHEGWLIKSPPTKRIWRARWRRRWFTLKQGEIPEQFCLEYYTDRNCRKLKGVIDLDQCEQVDCGLRLENRKQKFQYMFDIKTPKRTYYLAADTEADMRDWVNCICQVCHLHDTKQSHEQLQDENRAQNSMHNATVNTTTSTLNSSSATSASATMSAVRQASDDGDLLRRPGAAATTPASVIDQQPLQRGATSNNSDCVYVNAAYSNRETLLCETVLGQQQHATIPTTPHVPASSPSAALYLNSPVFQAQVQAKAAARAQSENARLAVNANGVVRKIPENLVLNSTPLSESQTPSVQPSPALSTASGPYIPISECFSGSPKFMIDGNNPTTPLNNLDPKFYDTPRSHNNIGLNLTNDQSYSPKITNCGVQQMPLKTRSDSDSESVFTDDDEWTHPLPLPNDRSTRPSDSSIENESFVLTYTQSFSKIPDGVGKLLTNVATSTTANAKRTKDPLDKLAKELKNKNNLILDFTEQKTPRDIPQLSDTENTSPAIGPRDASSAVEDSYDIPRSHNLPYYNMIQLFEKLTSSEAMATSTPNLLAGGVVAEGSGGPTSPAHVRTLPRPHCYTNAAPTKVEGNVFRYDFIEETDLPPVNRKLKPKVNLEDKPPEEVPAKPPGNAKTSVTTPPFMTAPSGPQNNDAAISIGMKPPSVDRNLKPDAYKLGKAALTRRNMAGASSMSFSGGDGQNYHLESHTLPRQLRGTNYATSTVAGSPNSSGITSQHQRTASAVAAVSLTYIPPPPLPPGKMEHKLQYFDLDVANPPPIHRQSMSVGNLNAPAGGARMGLSADPSVRAPVKSNVVYNSVDFVKTEAFKRIREEREEREKKSDANNANAVSGK